MVDVSERLSFFAALFKVQENSTLGMWLLYITIVVLCIIVFKLGFAKKLPIAKSIMIYIFLILGCTLLTFFAVFLPITEGLVVAALILIIYKVRLHQTKKLEGKEFQDGAEQMKSLQDTIYNWLTIKVVADERPDDTAAADTEKMFLGMLTDDHEVSNLEIETDEVMYYVHYDHAGERKKARYPKELIEIMLNQINENPDKYENYPE